MSKFAIAVMNLSTYELRAFVVDASDRKEAVVSVAINVLTQLGSDEDVLESVRSVNDMTDLSNILEECDLMISRSIDVDLMEQPEMFSTDSVPEDTDIWEDEYEIGIDDGKV